MTATAGWRCTIYQQMEWQQIVECWQAMNGQLIRAASAISPQAANRKLTVGKGKPITLDFLVNDYVNHLLHRLRHIGIDVAFAEAAISATPRDRRA